MISSLQLTTEKPSVSKISIRCEKTFVNRWVDESSKSTGKLLNRNSRYLFFTSYLIRVFYFLIESCTQEVKGLWKCSRLLGARSDHFSHIVALTTDIGIFFNALRGIFVFALTFSHFPLLDGWISRIFRNITCAKETAQFKPV